MGAAGQAGSQALVPGSGSIIMHDIMCAQLEASIAEGDWVQAYILATQLHQNLENMYHKARRPASNTQPLSCMQHRASLFNHAGRQGFMMGLADLHLRRGQLAT